MVKELSKAEKDAVLNQKKPITLVDAIGKLIGTAFAWIFALGLIGLLIKFLLWSWNWLI